MSNSSNVNNRVSIYRLTTYSGWLLGLFLPWQVLADGNSTPTEHQEEIIIVASRVATPLVDTGLSISTLSADDIELLGYNDLAPLLDLQPGVSVSQDGGLGKAAAVRIRGEDGFRTRILLDGIDIADPSSPQVSPRVEQLLSAGLQRIEILRGPQGLLYGADAGGVIAISTLQPQDGLNGRLGLETGANGFSRVNTQIAGGSEQLQGSLSVADLDTDGFNARADDQTLSDRDGYRNQTLHATATATLSRFWQVGASVHSVEGNNDYDNCFDAVTFATLNTCNDDYSQRAWRTWARWEGDSLVSEVSVADSRIDRTLFSAGIPTFDTQGEQRELSWLGSAAIGNGQFTLGIDLLEQGFTDGGERKQRDNQGVYGEYRRDIFRGNLSMGVRHDDNDDFGQHTSWRLSTLQPISTEILPTVLHAAIGTGFRAPSPYEIAYNAGPFASAPATDQALREENSRGWEIGLRLGGDNHWTRLTWFDQRIDNAIDFDLAGFSGYVQQQGASISEGLEFEAQSQLGTGLRLAANATWNKAENPEGNRRAYRPRLSGAASLQWQQDSWQSAITARFSRDNVDNAGLAMDDYVVVDWSLRRALTRDLTATLRLENVLDRDYQQIRNFNTSGRLWYLGLQYNL